MKGKSVTLLLGTLSGGGSESVCINLANFLSARGWDVTLVCVNLKSRDYESAVTDKVNLVDLKAPRLMLAFFYLIPFLRKEQPSLVLSFHYYTASLLLLCRLFLRKKYKVLLRNNISLSSSEKNKEGLDKIAFKFVKLIYKKFDAVISQCKSMEKELLSSYGVSPKKSHVIYNPLKPLQIQKNKKEIKGVPENYILSVGRLSDQKQFRHAIYALKMLSEQGYDSLRLVIVGQGGELKNLKDYSRELCVSERVIFLGFTKELGMLYKGAKLTLMTSKFEGFPNVLIESISVGTPVVSYDCATGPSEIVVDNVNGLLVEKNNKTRLVKALTSVLDADWDSDEIIGTSLRFSPDSIVPQYERLLLSYQKNN
ncbi:glycosyltransferase [Idiomarina piscisalsi]|nr:glycosyltransferase [Idiomarina piscisalsi]